MDEQEWTGGRGDHRAEDAAMKGSISGPYPDRGSMGQNVRVVSATGDGVVVWPRSPGPRRAVESPPG